MNEWHDISISCRIGEDNSMKVPKAIKLPSGAWRIQLRINGNSVSITAPTESECIKKAELEKIKRQNGLEPAAKCDMLLSDAIDAYISNRDATCSPLTIRGYDRIKKYRFKNLMGVKVSALVKYTEEDWQSVINDELKLVSSKTAKNSLAFIKSVIEHTAKVKVSMPKLVNKRKSQRAFLTPDEIKVFVEQCVKNRYAIPMLLMLSSLRISEVNALRWENIPQNAKFVRVDSAMVQDKDNNWVIKDYGKTSAAMRNVPILIPELSREIERRRQDSGFVMECSQNTLRVNIEKTCRDAGVTIVTPHELRHSFASLSYHLQIPEKICQEIGGWEDYRTMHEIYTHIAQSDIEHYQNAIAEFYAR